MTQTSPSSGPSLPGSPEVLKDDEIVGELAKYLDIADADVLGEMGEIVKEADETGKNDMRRWITSLQAIEGRMATATTIDWRELGVKPNVLLLKQTLKTRREMLFAILKKLGEKAENIEKEDKDKKMNNACFINIGEVNIAEEIYTIEEHIFNPPKPEDDSTDKNPIYKKNDIAILSFSTIHEYEEKLNIALSAIDTNTIPENQKATEERIQRMRAGLALIERSDPIQAARYSVESSRDASGLGKPVRLLAFSAVTVLAILSSITVLRKLANKEKLSPGDALAPAYIAAALVLAGVDITGKSDEDFKKIGRIVIEMKNGRLREIAEKMDKDDPKKAAINLHNLLNKEVDGDEEGNEEKFKKLLKDNSDGIEHETLKDTFGETDLVKALNKPAITNKDRRDFLMRLFDMNIKENLDSAKVAVTSSLYEIK